VRQLLREVAVYPASAVRTTVLFKTARTSRRHTWSVTGDDWVAVDVSNQIEDNSKKAML